jgi:hypothetical protein
MSYIKKYIRKENKNSFIAVVKDMLINDYDVKPDEDGDLSTGELAITEDEIGIATMLHDDMELEMYYVDGRTKGKKVKALFSVEYLADEMIGRDF